MEIYKSCNMVNFRKAIDMMEEYAAKIEQMETALAKVHEYKDDEELVKEHGMKELAKAIIFNLEEEEQEEIFAELDVELHDGTREELLKEIGELESKISSLEDKLLQANILADDLQGRILDYKFGRAI